MSSPIDHQPHPHLLPGARGIRGLIPQVYSVLEQRFVALARSRLAPLTVLHYARPGWTYHAKGLWMWPRLAPCAALPTTPFLSIIGA